MIHENRSISLSGDCTSVRGLNKEFISKMKLAELEYKNKVECKLRCMERDLNSIMVELVKNNLWYLKIQQSLQMI